MTDLVVAECAVRQLHARYIDAVWRHDFDCFVDCFAEDAEWKVAGMHLRGRVQIRAGIEKFMAPMERTFMMFGTPILEVGDGTAIGRTYVREYNKAKNGETASTIGIYYERFVDQGDRWRFQWRQWMLQYIGPPDLSAPVNDCNDFGPPPGMPGPDDPTMIRKSFLQPQISE
jgi:uncharacterized protein (TIGR02246 family)